ncbi:ferritin-like domain-containing protein [Kingella kingae]|uniref:ferritin-like domain-containing protein n=1 Tax=Kingella kingae TaxID=504 RepID=UPI00254ED796|nr:ferritin-like domain-containing protein [Kingella kingae]MDK4528394.1 ferritin-like domain-containing protein [Kingella kingae]MDK4542084.1 ferritin-like domain-containing protein [Kingella kingae]MDK4601867.1 ferritin-like domain-containing protein [Kingella kingae]MDK4631882.1 ferritin-like domain-containing protein [Kingella kingae]MDK4633704.1 ferritin-like domain-containing protein [Kingella kingae]
MQTLYSLLYQALTATDPDQKCAQTFVAYDYWCAGCLCESPEPESPIDVLIAGRPERPILVPHTQVEQRKPSTPEGYAAMLHAIAHIEFNAINLALDAAYRFHTLPREFVGNWLGVAKEECEHFMLMRDRLREHGFDYGDFPAHAHLWDMAKHTAYDPLLRMALVPRVLEARGLDVTPAIRAKVAQRGDDATCDVLDIIYRDEVGHVKIGNRWYHYLCQQRELEPLALFRQLLKQHDMFVFRGYVNLEARQRAGFSEFELSLLHDFEQAQKL